MIIVGQSPNIRSIAENRRRSTEAYRRVMSTWPSMMVGTAAKFHLFLLLSIMGGISLTTIYDRKFRYNRPEEGLPKMITSISTINMVAEDNHLYFAYKSPLGSSEDTGKCRPPASIVLTIEGWQREIQSAMSGAGVCVCSTKRHGTRA